MRTFTFAVIVSGCACLVAACSGSPEARYESASVSAVADFAASSEATAESGVSSWEARDNESESAVRALDERGSIVATLVLRPPTDPSRNGVEVTSDGPTAGTAFLRNDGVVEEATSPAVERMVTLLYRDMATAQHASDSSAQRNAQRDRTTSSLRAATPTLEATSSSAGLQYYGNYCGPNPGSSDYSKPFIDLVDLACMQHDQCYDRTNYLNCGCDRALLSVLPAYAPTASPAGQAAAFGMMAFFSGSPCFCISPVCIFLPHLCAGIGGRGSVC